MWELEHYADFEKRLKKLAKRHRQEAANTLTNLKAYLQSLRSGLKPQQIIRGYVHPEPRGIVAIDESGPKNPQKALRLYVYPEEGKELLHVLTIGGKDTQPDDIKHCEEFVEALLNEIQTQIRKDEPHYVGQTNQPKALVSRRHGSEHPA